MVVNFLGDLGVVVSHVPWICVSVSGNYEGCIIVLYLYSLFWKLSEPGHDTMCMSLRSDSDFDQGILLNHGILLTSVDSTFVDLCCFFLDLHFSALSLARGDSGSSRIFHPQFARRLWTLEALKPAAYSWCYRDSTSSLFSGLSDWWFYTFCCHGTPRPNVGLHNLADWERALKVKEGLGNSTESEASTGPTFRTFVLFETASSCLWIQIVHTCLYRSIPSSKACIKTNETSRKTVKN